jgi:hypothetical protein
MNLESSTLKDDETGEPFHVQQAAQIRAFRAAWKEAGHAREPRVSVSRSIFALVDDRDRSYFGRGREEGDQVGLIDEKTRAIFGRSYAAEPDVLVEQLRRDSAIAEAAHVLKNNFLDAIVQGDSDHDWRARQSHPRRAWLNHRSRSGSQRVVAPCFAAGWVNWKTAPFGRFGDAATWVRIASMTWAL